MNNKMYSSEELEVLIAGLEKRRDLVSGHLGGMYNTMAEQRKGWEEIEREINSINFRVRTVKDIRHKWLDLKSRTKKKGSRINKSLQETGGGFPLKTKLTSLEERVLNLMGQSAVYGLLAGYDTSSVNEEIYLPTNEENINRNEPIEMRENENNISEVTCLEQFPTTSSQTDNSLNSERVKHIPKSRQKLSDDKLKEYLQKQEEILKELKYINENLKDMNEFNKNYKCKCLQIKFAKLKLLAGENVALEMDLNI